MSTVLTLHWNDTNIQLCVFFATLKRNIYEFLKYLEQSHLFDSIFQSFKSFYDSMTFFWGGQMDLDD